MNKNAHSPRYLLVAICIFLWGCQSEQSDKKQVSPPSKTTIVAAPPIEMLHKPYGNWVSDLKELRYEKNELQNRVDNANRILTTYHVIPKDEWLHSYHHISAEPYIKNDMNTIVFRKNKRYQLIIRPGGLATLLSDDNQVLYLARELQPFMKEKMK